MRNFVVCLLTGSIALSAFSCGDDDPTLLLDDNSNSLTNYSFSSRFIDGQSSVSYAGQTRRQLLILDIKAAITGLDSNAASETGTVAAAIERIYAFSSNIPIGTNPPIRFQAPAPGNLQTTWDDLGGPNRLSNKLAGKDDSYERFGGAAENDGVVIGYADDNLSPEETLLDMFNKLDEVAVTFFQGNRPQSPEGNEISQAYTSSTGINYAELIQKYLGGALAFNQGADDYLDDDKEDKGLNSSNSQSGSNPYSSLEHAWDEGFGYFGAARDYVLYTDDEIASKGGRPDWQGAHDTNGDDSIDLLSEINFGHSVNAAKRDRGSNSGTNFTLDAWTAFTQGRSLITQANGELSDAELNQLRTYRNQALAAWERSISSTVVHYINDTLRDMNAMGTPAYDFENHAKHWSELKGFLLALQFIPSRHSPVTDADHRQLNQLIGNAPVLSNAGDTALTAYATALNDAKGILQQAYGFDAADMGNADGTGGW